MSEFSERLKIDRIEDDVIWLQVNNGDGTGFQVPLAQMLRDYLDDSAKAEDDARDDGWNTEVAFAKLKIGKAFDKELTRA